LLLLVLLLLWMVLVVVGCCWWWVVVVIVVVVIVVVVVVIIAVVVVVVVLLLLYLGVAFVVGTEGATLSKSPRAVEALIRFFPCVNSSMNFEISSLRKGKMAYITTIDGNKNYKKIFYIFWKLLFLLRVNFICLKLVFFQKYIFT